MLNTTGLQLYRQDLGRRLSRRPGSFSYFGKDAMRERIGYGYEKRLFIGKGHYGGVTAIA